MGIFLRQDLHVWADTVSPQMNTIASHDQFKPILIKIRIRENLWLAIIAVRQELHMRCSFKKLKVVNNNLILHLKIHKSVG